MIMRSSRVALLLAGALLAAAPAALRASSPFESYVFAKERTVNQYEFERLNDFLGEGHKPPLTEQSVLHGPNLLALRAVDALTGRPVESFTIYGFILYDMVRRKPVYPDDMDSDEAEEKGISPIEYKTRTDTKMLGRLESKRVESPDDACLYRDLPNGCYQFEVLAKGYVPLEHVLRLPADGPEATVTLMPGGEIHGRVVDDQGDPVQDMSFSFTQMRTLLWTVSSAEFPVPATPRAGFTSMNCRPRSINP